MPVVVIVLFHEVLTGIIAKSNDIGLGCGYTLENVCIVSAVAVPVEAPAYGVGVSEAAQCIGDAVDVIADGLAAEGAKGTLGIGFLVGFEPGRIDVSIGCVCDILIGIHSGLVDQFPVCDGRRVFVFQLGIGIFPLDQLLDVIPCFLNDSLINNPGFTVFPDPAFSGSRYAHVVEKGEGEVESFFTSPVNEIIQGIQIGCLLKIPFAVGKIRRREVTAEQPGPQQDYIFQVIIRYFLKGCRINGQTYFFQTVGLP